MNTLTAFAIGQANRGKEMMVFDWDKAAKMIAENKPESASAGLCGDWEYTGGTIFENGKPIPREDTYTFLASTWATPELEMDGCIYDCYIMESEIPKSWGKDCHPSEYYWPGKTGKSFEN